MGQLKALPLRGLIEYEGFYIDEEISDHSVTLINKKHGIKKVFTTSFMAKCFVDGFNERDKLKIVK